MPRTGPFPSCHWLVASALLKFVGPQQQQQQQQQQQTSTHQTISTSDHEGDLEEDEQDMMTTSCSSMAVPLQFEGTPHLSITTSSPPRDTTSQEGTQIISNQIISDDPALWPKAIDDNARCQIVRKGPLQITDMDFPQNSENPPRRFTKENYKMTMRNVELMAQYDPVLSEHIRRIQNKETKILQALSALQTFAVEKRDSETMSTANALHDELKSWRFLLCTMIWYNVLYQVNLMSKLLQSPDVSLETLRTETQGVRQYLENFRDSGLASCQSDAVEIAEELEIEKKLPEKRQRKAAKRFQHEGAAETQSSPEESFKREFFLPLVDTALRSLNDRFSKMEDVYVLYSFLFSKKSMQQVLKSGTLRARCKNLEQTMHDIEADDLELEINSAVYTFPDHASTCPNDMLNYIYSERLMDLYSNLSIALRLLLTLPVSVASGDNSGPGPCTVSSAAALSDEGPKHDVQPTVLITLKPHPTLSRMEQISAEVGIPITCIFPVKNYTEETNLNDDIDSLILSTLRHIIDFGEDLMNRKLS
ncbi:hypothetical protein NFI96_003229 [Scomber scombrus]|uniref:Uncharacterized protein n=1 Tax=Scomber scombrus TaxID=13677 RepID=A0AAV1PX38_SCOSC